MESFFSLLQKNVLDRQRCPTRHDLRLAIITWIERTYHRRLRHRRLGKLTPVELRDDLHNRARGLTNHHHDCQLKSGQTQPSRF